MRLNRQQLIRLASGALGIGALAAIGWYTYEAFNSGLTLSQLRMNWLIAAFALHIVVIAVLPLMWIRLLALVKTSADSEPSINDKRLVHAYARSWLARYIPGRVWMFGGRILYGRSAGISTRSITSSTTLEAGLSYSALGLLGAAMLVGAWIHWSVAVVLAAGAFGASLILLRLLFNDADEEDHDNRLFKLILKGSSLLKGDLKPSGRALFAVLLMYWIHAGVQLVFFIFVALSVQSFESGDYLLLAGAWGVGASIGYLSVFSAGGLGVRDGVALAFVGPAFTGPVAGAVVAVSRIILVLADLVLVGLVEVLFFMLRKREAKSPVASQAGLPSAINRKVAVEKGS